VLTTTAATAAEGDCQESRRHAESCEFYLK
jgi:hypothetical protein